MNHAERLETEYKLRTLMPNIPRDVTVSPNRYCKAFLRWMADPANEESIPADGSRANYLINLYFTEYGKDK